jgi:integrase
MLALYRRIKDPSGNWCAEKVREGRGVKTSGITGPFYVRPLVDGIQKRIALTANNFAEARYEADQLEKTTVVETPRADSLPIRTVVETYLSQKKSKSKKTLQQYRLALHEFINAIDVQYIHEITVKILRTYKEFLVAQGYAGKTIDTRINIVYFMLKKNGVAARLPKDELPPVETETAVPYSEGDLERLFAKMDKEQTVQYKFFLGSACRDREVRFAAWADINFDKGTYTIRSKLEAGFTVKNHESRTVPLPSSLVALLKAHRKSHPNTRWIFEDKNNGPHNDFLRKLKSIAKRAGINCGQCSKAISKWSRGQKHIINVSCKTGPHCEHIYLHRFRKTCATRWSEADIPIRTVQHYLGHKSLEVTARYLGVSDSDKVRDKINKAFGG